MRSHGCFDVEDDLGVALDAVRRKELHTEVDLIDHSLSSWMPAAPQLQVLDPIVELVAVAMMDGFTRQQVSPEVTFHDDAMLEAEASSVFDLPVSAICDVTASARGLSRNEIAVASPAFVMSVTPSPGCLWALTSVDDAGSCWFSGCSTANPHGVAVLLESAVVLVAVATDCRCQRAFLGGAGSHVIEDITQNLDQWDFTPVHEDLLGELVHTMLVHTMLESGC